MRPSPKPILHAVPVGPSPPHEVATDDVEPARHQRLPRQLLDHARDKDLQVERLGEEVKRLADPLRNVAGGAQRDPGEPLEAGALRKPLEDLVRYEKW